MDNLSLEVLVNELRIRVLNASIHRIKLTSDRTLILALRSRVTEYLILSLQPGFPSLCISPEEVPSETSRSDTLLALRKHLLGGKIAGLHKALADRVVFLEIENCRLSEQPERFGLAIELIPNRARACLLDAQQEVQVWLSSPPGPFGTYLPRAVPVCRVDSIEEDEFRSLFESAGDASGLSPVFGLSSWFAREVFFQGQQDSGKAWQALQALLRRVASGPYSPRIYHVEQTPTSSVIYPSKPQTKQVIAPFALDSLGSTRYEGFSSMNALSVEVFHQSFERGERLKGRQSGGDKVATEIKKKDRLKEKLQTQLRTAAEAQSLKTYADLLYAQHDKSAKGTALRVPNLFDPDLGEVDIPLVPELSLIENANRYHRLYRKAGRSISQITERLGVLELEIVALRQEEERLVKENFEKTLLSDRLSSETSADAAQTDNTAKPTNARSQSAENLRSRPVTLERRTAKVFRSSEGMQILVGKSSKDNDVLTLKVARSEDFWLHVAGYGGSHVVLRNPEKLPVAPKQSLLEAAQLAAYFSQARNAPKVEVHYTQKRFVSKPKGSKPGLVRLKEYRSISARPQLLEEGKMNDFE